MISAELDAQPPNAALSATIPNLRIFDSPQTAASKRNLRAKAMLHARKPPGRAWRRLAGDFRQLQPLCSHLSEDSARLAIGHNLRQLQAMGSEGDVLLSFVD